MHKKLVVATSEHGDAMTPNLYKYLNIVTSLQILGKFIYLHLSRTCTNSSRLKPFYKLRELSNNSPTSSFIASMTIAKFVVCGVF